MLRVLAAPIAMLGEVELLFHLLSVACGEVVDPLAGGAGELCDVILRHNIF